MKAIVYGRETCGVCKNIAGTLKKLGCEVEHRDIDYYLSPHDGWQNDGSLNIRVALSSNNEQLPVVALPTTSGPVYLSGPVAVNRVRYVRINFLEKNFT